MPLIALQSIIRAFGQRNGFEATFQGTANLARSHKYKAALAGRISSDHNGVGERMGYPQDLATMDKKP